jgi:hypothetical protein
VVAVVISRFQRFLARCRISIGPYRPIKKPAFLADQRLELRDGKLELRELAQRNLIEDQPDYRERDWPRDGNGSPIDYDNEGLPNG